MVRLFVRFAAEFGSYSVGLNIGLDFFDCEFLFNLALIGSLLRLGILLRFYSSWSLSEALSLRSVLARYLLLLLEIIFNSFARCKRPLELSCCVFVLISVLVAIWIHG